MAIIAPIPRGERRRMKKAIQTTKDKDYARRLIALMQLHEGRTIVDVCRIISAARSSVGRWCQRRLKTDPLSDAIAEVKLTHP